MDRREHGYSLIELVAVITVLGLVAAIAVPSVSSTDSRKLDLAASEVAEAIRFARSEAIRLGEPRGFRQQVADKRIRVFSLDMSVSPPARIFDVRHPISKQLYDVDLDDHSLAAADSITRTATWRGACNQQGRMYFDANGTPWCSDPENVLLDKFAVTLTLGQISRVVTLDGISGRVTVQ
ncbi:MAG: pilus assembly FimT family protein [Woeseiaceae bacterium]